MGNRVFHNLKPFYQYSDFSAKHQKVIKKYFYSTIRQNSWGWGHDLNNEELNQIKKQIETFYLNGESAHDAPFLTKCDVRNSTGTLVKNYR